MLLAGEAEVREEEYMASVGVLDASSAQIYQYLNFDKLDEYRDVAAGVAA